MKKQSVYGLVNLSELSRIVKQADVIYWAQEDGKSIVSDGHAIFAFYGVCEALFTRFQRMPDVLLSSRKRGREYETIPVPQLSESFAKFLNDDQNASVDDTRLWYQMQEDREVRVMLSTDWRDSSRDYVFISAGYFLCIGKYEKAYSPAASRRKPVTFINGDEKAVILPVNYGAKPEALADI